MSRSSATLLRRSWRWIRQRPTRSALIGFALFALLVPVWPYRPVCDGYSWDHFRRLEGQMTPEYLAAIDRALGRAGVYHWRVGNHIYLTLVPHDPDRDFALYYAQEGAVNRLVRPAVSGSYVGKELLGRVHWPPGYVQAFLDDDGRPIDYHDCVFVRAVAFGEAPPPGYRPEPSFLDRARNTSQ
jgi:hypothetical protein